MIISFYAYQFLIWIWMGVALAVFFLLLRINAPYGRHSSVKWGPAIDNHIAWLLMELPALVVMGFCFTRVISVSVVVAVLTGLYCLHYINRTIIFPFRIRTRGKKMPVVIMGSAVFFNLVNTFFLGYYFTHFNAYPDNYFSSPLCIAGVILFFTGLSINWWADNRLIHLRRPGETGYKIPTGGLFNLISCPNMMGELLEWGGYAIVCRNLPALAFLVWTVANLLPRALAHHRWYKKEFRDYPTGRKAIIPFIL